MNIVERLILYIDTRDATVLNITDNSVPPEDLTVLAINLISWMRLEHQRKQWTIQGMHQESKPMKLDVKNSWCISLENQIKMNSVFGEVFKVKEDSLIFNDNVSEQNRKSLCQMAFCYYNQPMFI